MVADADPRLRQIEESIREIPDFPKPGILFQDVTTLVGSHAAFRHTIDLLFERYQGQDIHVVAGVCCAVFGGGFNGDAARAAATRRRQQNSLPLIGHST